MSFEFINIHNIYSKSLNKGFLNLSHTSFIKDNDFRLKHVFGKFRYNSIFVQFLHLRVLFINVGMLRDEKYPFLTGYLTVCRIPDIRPDIRQPVCRSPDIRPDIGNFDE